MWPPCLILGGFSEAGQREVLLQRLVAAALGTVDDDGVPLVLNTLHPSSSLNKPEISTL